MTSPGPRIPTPLPDAPLISVVTVSYNQGEFIRQNIESVLAQNYPNFEHVIADGGSSDGTIPILKEYPHLKWVSEPDRNQCHALNKGFARAKGDIICWLNSDDWLAPGAFQEVIAHLRSAEVLMTAAAETDKAGNVKQIVPNTGRTFHDILRYWVPHAWLAQTGIFFRRSLLEEVKRPGGEYVDESLNFVMDMDLWLRMARLTPFTVHSDKVCAYFRMYEENKTGKNPLSTQRECGRAYRRAINESCRAERPLSFIMPLNRFTPEALRSLDSLVNQETILSDLIFTDYSGNREDSEGIKKLIDEIEKRFNTLAVRYIKVKNSSPIDAMFRGMLDATSPVVATLWPGDVLDSRFSQEVVSSFAIDPAGLVIPCGGNAELKRVLFDEHISRIRLDGLLTDIPIPFCFAARKAAVEEMAPAISKDCPVTAMRQVIALAAARCWYIRLVEKLSLKAVSPLFENQPAKTGAFGERLNALIIKLAASVQNGDSFGKARIRGTWGLPVSSQAEQAADEVLAGS